MTSWCVSLCCLFFLAFVFRYDWGRRVALVEMYTYYLNYSLKYLFASIGFNVVHQSFGCSLHFRCCAECVADTQCSLSKASCFRSKVASAKYLFISLLSPSSHTVGSWCGWSRMYSETGPRGYVLSLHELFTYCWIQGGVWINAIGIHWLSEAFSLFFLRWTGLRGEWLHLMRKHVIQARYRNKWLMTSWCWRFISSPGATLTSPSACLATFDTNVPCIIQAFYSLVGFCLMSSRCTKSPTCSQRCATSWQAAAPGWTRVSLSGRLPAA